MIKRVMLSSNRYIDLLDVSGYERRKETPIFQQITDAARVSYDGGSKGYEADKKLLKYLIDNNHSTPMEMVDFKFRVKCSIFTARQWFRHRIGSFNEISGRYTEFDEEFYIPQSFNNQSTNNKQGRSSVHRDDPFIREQYTKRIGQCLSTYKQMIDMGVSKEQARMVLPVSLLTNFIWKVNLRSLANFVTLRADPHAQFEIREFATIIRDDFLKDFVPEVHELIT